MHLIKKAFWVFFGGWGSWFRVELILIRKAWWWQHASVDHVTSEVEKKRAMNAVAQFTFSFLSSPGTEAMAGYCHAKSWTSHRG